MTRAGPSAASLAETGNFLGVEAVIVDGEGDVGIDAADDEIAAQARPDVVILAAMARRGVDEAGAGRRR